MYAGIVDNESCREVPDWKRMLILKKRATFAEETCRRADSNSNMLQDLACKKSADISVPKTVTIGNINVELRSVRAESCPARCPERDSELDDLRYGPGIVDRLRAKFLNLGAQQPRQPVVRRFSSLENLPGSNLYRLHSKSSCHNGLVHCKAQSMEALVSPPLEHSQVFAKSRLRLGLKSRIIGKGISPIPAVADENEEEPEQSPVHHLTRSSSLINEHELPKPDTVKLAKKMFESPPVTNCAPEKPQCYRQVSPKCRAPSARPLLSPSVNKGASDLSSPLVQAQIASPENGDLGCEEDTPEQAPLEDQTPASSPAGHSELAQRDPLMVVTGQSQLARGDSQVVVTGLDCPADIRWKNGSVVFDFRGKDVKPNVALKPTPFGCRPALVERRPGSPERVSPDEESWDESDVGADLPAISGVVFCGENIKIGRGALLATRNKKLSIQFNDQATATFEYPSEYLSPSPQAEVEPWENTLNAAVLVESQSNSRPVLSNYIPQFLCSNDEFELGVSQLNPRPTSMPEQFLKINSPLDVIIPANSHESSGWSSTETSDILF